MPPRFGLKAAEKKRARPPQDRDVQNIPQHHLPDEVDVEAEEGEADDADAADQGDEGTVDDPYAPSSFFAEQIAKSTARGVVAGMRAFQEASQGGSSSSGEPMIKISKTKMVEVVGAINTAAAAAAHAENLSIAAAQAFKKEEVKIHKMKKMLADLTGTN